MSENLSIWNAVSKTDPKYTKDATQKGQKTTSINTTYMVMKATEAFGPVGVGWGFDVVEERFDKTNPVLIDRQPLMIGDEPLWCYDHTIKLRLWHGNKEQYVEQYGHTPYKYWSQKNGYMVVDSDYAKKTLSDAMKKCLSLLGVCADIFLGEFDDFNYVQEQTAISDAKRNTQKGESQIEAVNSLKDKVLKSIELMATASTWNQAEKLYFGAVNELATQGPIYGLDVDEEKQPLDQAYFEAKERLTND